MKFFSISHAMLCSPLPCCIIFFIALHVHKLDSVPLTGNFKVNGPDHPITAIAGKEIVLPCHLLPRMSAENMEVRWYRTQFLEVIHLYRDGIDHYEKQIPAYQGRTELLRDGIADGNIALRIYRITPADEGHYSCFIQSSTFYGEAMLELKVADVFFPRVSRWMVALWVILALLGFLVFPAIYYFWKKHKAKGELLAELRWSNVRQHAVDVTLDPDTAYPHLVLSEDRKSVEWRPQHRDVPDYPKRFDCVTCVLGYEGFISGRHYWEIDVGGGTTWGVGVAKESVSRKGWIHFSPQEGIWAVDECRGQHRALAPIEIPLSLSKSIRKIGIYLDYEGGRVAFYDLVREDPFFTFTAHFSEKVFPFFLVYSQITVCLRGTGE
uniref:Butyrophilin subfamily 1 member A1-like n=1 Tax=Terrapene triunguis TaxID=2587831 RepID=A0A674JKL7_9SAUR